MNPHQASPLFSTSFVKASKTAEVQTAFAKPSDMSIIVSSKTVFFLYTVRQTDCVRVFDEG